MKMKNALLSLTEAVRLARLEIACYRDDMCRGTAEGTVERLAQILGNDEMNAHGPGPAADGGIERCGKISIRGSGESGSSCHSGQF